MVIRINDQRNVYFFLVHRRKYSLDSLIIILCKENARSVEKYYIFGSFIAFILECTLELYVKMVKQIKENFKNISLINVDKKYEIFS